MNPEALPIQKFSYFFDDAEEFRIAEADVYYEMNGKKYKRFYKGQEIPKEEWERYFSREEVSDIEDTNQIEEFVTQEESTSETEEVVLEEPIQEELVIEEPQETEVDLQTEPEKKEVIEEQILEEKEVEVKEPVKRTRKPRKSKK